MQWGRHLSFSHQVALSFETFRQQENIPFGMSIHLPMLWTGQRQLWLHKMIRKPKKNIEKPQWQSGVVSEVSSGTCNARCTRSDEDFEIWHDLLL